MTKQLFFLVVMLNRISLVLIIYLTVDNRMLTFQDSLFSHDTANEFETTITKQEVMIATIEKIMTLIMRKMVIVMMRKMVTMATRKVVTVAIRKITIVAT